MDITSLRHVLAGNDWQRQFDPATLERGTDYAHTGRVLTLGYRPNNTGGVLSADVTGQGGKLYRVMMAIMGDPRRNEWLCECTCPVTFDCKHAVAALLIASQLPPASWPRDEPRRRVDRSNPQWLAQMIAEIRARDSGAATPPAPRRAPSPVNDERVWDNWLRSLDRREEPEVPSVETDRVFGLMLRADRSAEPPRLLAAPVWLRPGKTRRGGLVDPKPLRLLERGPAPAPAAGWATDDLAPLAVLLQEARHQFGTATTVIHSAHVEQALADLMQRHPVYFERAGDGAFAFAETLPLNLNWRALDDGDQRLEASAGAEETLILHGAGLWYVQPGSRRVGRIDASPQWLERIRVAPALPPERVAALREKLAAPNRRLAIPMPDERAAAQSLEAVPQAVLTLRVIDTSWRHSYQRSVISAGCARLMFDYGGVRVAAGVEPFVRAFRNGALYEIRRDVGAEGEAEDRLERAGLISAQTYAQDQGLPGVDFGSGDLLLQPIAAKAPLAPEAWKPVLDELADAGLRIEYETGFPRHQVIDIDAWHADLDDAGNAWFNVSLGIDVGGQRIDLLPILRGLFSDPRFSLAARKGEDAAASLRVVIDDERSVDMPLAQLRALIGPLLEWLDVEPGESLRVHRSAAANLEHLGDAPGLVWHGAERLRACLDASRANRRDGAEPPGFTATLRDYQREGLTWLGFLSDTGVGGVLADDMGLGKTVQVLAHLLDEKQRGRLDAPALVVAPTSLVGNWHDEAARFAPDLSVLVLHGADRAARYDEIGQHDLVITTYPLLPRDRERLREALFSLLILDEAQAIKNPKSQAAKVVREIVARRRLAMTGTPLENHLGELWAQFDAVEPGILGGERHFARFYRTPIEKHADTDRQQRLNRRIAPLLLRRRKEDVLTELPPKTEIVQRLELSGAQRELYETLRLAQHARVRDAVRERGLGQSGIVVLDALLKLRQVCCDPRLVKLDSAKKIKESAKLDALLERLTGLIDEGRRVLVFSQFTEMLDLITQALTRHKIGHLMLTGQTPSSTRGDLVKRFQNGDVPVFLISLKAGGTGLNLTAADAVIHYDPWWNPAVETQATDRAHRIGQDKSVFVYKLICAGTVEEKIQAMQTRKSELAKAVLEGGSTQRLRLDEADLAELFAPLG